MPHPDLPLEQTYVDTAYARLAAKVADKATLREADLAADPKAAAALRRELASVPDGDGDQPLVFGRIDDATGEVAYIGRRSVTADDGTPLVISWKAPAAAPFFQADAEDPMGLQLRRRMLAEGRRLLDLRDEWFDELAQALAAGRLEIPDPPVLGHDLLLLELEGHRDGEMRDIVATIQAEQDRAIRSPPDGILVIQGGPGTGKSAVGLHRAAYLLFESLRSQRILVVGPSTAFMRYIQRVLPSLGEAEVAQESVTRLGFVVDVRAEDTRKTAAVKGSALMAEVLQRAVWTRVRPVELELALPRARVRVDRPDVERMVVQMRGATSYEDGRRSFSVALLEAVAREYIEALRDEYGLGDTGDATEQVRRNEQFERAVERVWPRLSAREVLRDLLSTRSQLVAHAAGQLEADQQALLLRTRARSMESEPWTLHDQPLLHELEMLISGEAGEHYSHIVVDEAQDLSPMQLRMIGRHCPRGSFTLLGDLAQATGPWSSRDWNTISEQLRPGARPRVAELTIGYRVPTETMAFASRLLPFTAPDLTAPSSVRQWEPPTLVPASEHQLMRRAVEEAERFSAEQRSCALVVPDQLEAAAASALQASGAHFGNAREDELAASITLLPASLAKGLEFEAVVLVEPAAFKAWGEDGLRWLYVALTRTTQALSIVHSKPLPPELATAGPGTGAPASNHASEVSEPNMERDSSRDSVIGDEDAPLMRENGLNEADQRLLAAVADWLRAQHR